jgi:hypothetical protein
VLRLDVDRVRLGPVYGRVVEVVRRLGWRPVVMVLRRTARGWHVKVVVRGRATPAVVVAVQAICGSDWRREAFNLVRVRAARRVAPEWRTRYSVLFTRKLGRVVL